MPYTPNTLAAITTEAGSYGFTTFIYDTTDAVSDVRAAGYISDAVTRGMQKGDLVITRVWSALPTTNASLLTAPGTAPTLSAVQLMPVLGISTAGAADLTDGTALTLTNS